MNIALLAAGLALVALPGWTSRLGRRLAPHEWARLTAASLWTGLVAVRLGLLVTAAPTALRALGVHRLAEACHQTLGPVIPGGAITGVASATALVVVQTRINRARRHSQQVRRTLRVESWLGEHHTAGDHELVVIPAASNLAYALEGDPHQIVLSEGLARVLSDDEIGAVIRHEHCHLENGHQRYLELAVATEAALRPLAAAGRSTATLRLALERWADEDAATDVDRATLRDALVKVVDTMLSAMPVPAFTSAETICERLDALDTVPQAVPAHWRVAAVAPAIALAATVGATLLTSSALIHHGILGLFGYCPL